MKKKIAWIFLHLHSEKLFVIYVSKWTFAKCSYNYKAVYIKAEAFVFNSHQVVTMGELVGKLINNEDLSLKVFVGPVINI